MLTDLEEAAVGTGLGAVLGLALYPATLWAAGALRRFRGSARAGTRILPMFGAGVCTGSDGSTEEGGR